MNRVILHFQLIMVNLKFLRKEKQFIALNVFYASGKENHLEHMYKSEHNFKRKNIVGLLYIADENDNGHFTTIKSNV